MGAWPHSDVTHSQMEGLVKKGLLRARTAANEWIVPGDEDELMLPDGYVISFIPFHEQGFATPPHLFLQGPLHYYGLELQHWDLAHLGLRCAVRGVYGDQAPL